MNPSRRLVCFVFCALAAAAVGVAGASAAAAPPRVMATIKPLHSLVAAVMSGIGEPPFLLIDGAISPHDFKLRVSDRARLESADVLLRVSGSLESRLHPRALPEKMQIWTLAEELPADVLLARREDLFEDHDHGHGDDHGDDHSDHDDHDDHDDHESERAAIDPHFWLSPRVASQVVSLLARKLSQIDPENADRYRQNAAATTRKIAALTEDIRAAFRAAPPRPYLAFHDAWQYFERDFGLRAAGAIVLDPRLPIGAGHASRLLRAARAGEAGCIVTEPQFESRRLISLVGEAGGGIKIVAADPLGVAATPGEDAYFEILRAVARAFSACAEVNVN